MYVGDISRSETGPIRVLTISDLQFTPFADIVMRHRISLEKTIRFITAIWFAHL